MNTKEVVYLSSRPMGSDSIALLPFPLIGNWWMIGHH